jgi:hypothetical protein
MSKAFGITFAAAVLIIGVLVWFGFSATKGNHLAPEGKIGKIRTQQVSDDVTFVVIDFNIRNDSDRDMVVHSISGTLDNGTEGSPVAAQDLVNSFHAYPALGDQYNPVLKERDIVPAHQNLDRMVGLRFDAPLSQVESRKSLTLKVQDATGPEMVTTK